MDESNDPRAVEQTTEPTVRSEPFSLDIKNDDLVSVIDKKIQESNTFFQNTLKLGERTKMLRNFWLGKHYEEKELDDYQIPYKDNIIYQDLETRISIASSRMPDIIVTPPAKGQDKIDAAKTIEQTINVRITSEMMKRLIKDGLRNLHLGFFAVLKVRWDKNKTKDGDYVYELIHNDRVTFDHTAIMPHDGFTADNMDWVCEWVEEPLAVVLSKFPEGKEELLRTLGIVNLTQKRAITKIKYQEIWFTWYDASGKNYEGVCWKYKQIILKKMKNPYYDWEGYQVARKDAKIDEKGNVITTDTLYHNHFERPRKPYIFFSYQNLGNSPIDDTNATEQAIPLQRTVNKRGRQITEISDRAIPKLAFSGRYITKEQARRVTNDIDEHIFLEEADDVNKAVLSIPATPPSPMLLNDLQINRSQIDSKFATHSVTRGELVPQESGISKQITREGDLTVADDLVTVTVDRVIEEMANWSVQMMKLMYDKPHFVRNVGKDGELVFYEIKRDLIEDGIMVNVKASSTDKTVRRDIALQMAQMGNIDPYSLMEDLEIPNIKERIKRLLLFQLKDPRYFGMVGAQELIGQGGEQGQQGEQGGQDNPQDQQVALADIQMLKQGQQPQPKQPTQGYLNTINQYVQGEEFAQQPPEFKQNLLGYIQSLSQSLGGEQNGQ